MPEIRDLIKKLDCDLLCGEDLLDRQIHGGYACDLLSWVISRINTDDVWLTILNSVNVVAVAVLSECSCILLTEGVTLDQDVLKRAQEKNVIVLSTKLPTFEAAAVVSGLLRNENV